MATYGGTFTLTPTGLDRKPGPMPKVYDPNPIVFISGQPRDRAVMAYTHKPMRPRRAIAGMIKRDGAETAIGSTRSWTGITEMAMIPATPLQRKEFAEERALRKVSQHVNRPAK